MGGCAGCMGPNRRANNYQVSRLTENSPIKQRVSVAELPTRNKERILQELNQSKRKYEQGNLISLLSSPVQPDKQSRVSRVDSPYLYSGKEGGLEEVPSRSSFMKLRKVESTLVERRPESNGFLDENIDKFPVERPLFVSEFRGDYDRPHNKVLTEIRLNREGAGGSLGGGGFGLKKKGMPNIPELADEDARTPNYIKDMRKQNGEDVKPTALDFMPRQLPPVPRLALQNYLRDLGP